jgi:magnesium transporter
VTVSVIDYTADQLTEEADVSIDRALQLGDSRSVTWINVDGVHDEKIVKRIGDHIRLHDLVQEDIVSPHQRPKADPDGEHIFVVLRMLQVDHEIDRLKSEQLSIIIGPRYVVTFQEESGDVFNPLRERLRGKGGRIRKRGSGYLGYAIIDAVVDHYFTVIDDIGDVVDQLEEELLTDPASGTQSRIYDLRRSLIQVRRAVWPVRELLLSLEKMDSSALGRDIHPFLRDVKDHVYLIIDAIEALRDSTTGLLDLHHTSLTTRANEVMKVLTIIATLFIPLTFIAGVYGMNFDNMPELRWPLGYPVVIAVMLSTAIGLLVMFKRKNWF